MGQALRIALRAFEQVEVANLRRRRQVVDKPLAIGRGPKAKDCVIATGYVAEPPIYSRKVSQVCPSFLCIDFDNTATVCRPNRLVAAPAARRTAISRQTAADIVVERFGKVARLCIHS